MVVVGLSQKLQEEIVSDIGVLFLHHLGLLFLNRDILFVHIELLYLRIEGGILTLQTTARLPTANRSNIIHFFLFLLTGFIWKPKLFRCWASTPTGRISVWGTPMIGLTGFTGLTEFIRLRG